MIPAVEPNEKAGAIIQMERKSGGTDFIELTTDRGISATTLEALAPEMGAWKPRKRMD